MDASNVYLAFQWADYQLFMPEHHLADDSQILILYVRFSVTNILLAVHAANITHERTSTIVIRITQKIVFCLVFYWFLFVYMYFLAMASS